jgi:hypothetical protein
VGIINHLLPPDVVTKIVEGFACPEMGQNGVSLRDYDLSYVASTVSNGWDTKQTYVFLHNVNQSVFDDEIAEGLRSVEDLFEERVVLVLMGHQRREVEIFPSTVDHLKQ